MGNKNGSAGEQESNPHADSIGESSSQTGLLFSQKRTFMIQ